MVTSEPPDATLSTEPDSVTTAILNVEIETLTASKDMIKAGPVKAVFESVIVILTLVRVRLLVLFLFLHLLTDDTVRTRWWRKIRLWNWPKPVPERATC